MDTQQQEQPAVINSTDFPAVTTIPNIEKERLQQEAEKAKPSFTDAFKISRDLDAALPAIERLRAGTQHLHDENFRLSQEDWDVKTQGINPENLPSLLDAKSSEHFDSILRRIKLEQDAEKQIASMGFTGTGARLLANLFDETALGLTIASEGLASPWIAASKAGSFARIAKSAIVGGSVNAGLEGLVQQSSEARDANNILWAAAAGSILGPLAYRGIKGADELPDTSKALQGISESIQRETLGNGGVDTAGAMRATVVPDLPYDMPVDDAIARMANEHSGLQELPWYLGGKTVGKALDATRFSLAGLMKKSEWNTSRYIAKNFLEDGVDGGDITSSLIQHTEFNHLMSGYARVRNDAYKGWKVEQGKTTNPFRIFSDAEARQEFNVQVARAVRGEDIESPFVKQVAAQIADDNKRIVGMLKKAGVEGFENVSEDPHYLSRIWQSEKMHGFNARYGGDATRGLISGAIRSAVPEIEEELASRLSKAIFNRFTKGTGAEGFNLQRLFGNERYDDIEEFLLDSGVAANDVETLLYSLRNAAKVEGKGVPSRAKRRVLLDENFGMHMKDGSGNTEFRRVSELFEEDADRLHSSYVRQMTGYYALAMKGVKSRADWNRLTRRMADEAVGSAKMTEKLQREMDKADFIYDTLIGRPPKDSLRDKHPEMARYLSMVRDHEFLVSMGQTGWAQIPEFAAVVSQLGVRSIMAHVPGFKEIINIFRKGDIEQTAKPLFNEINDLLGGFGVGRILHQPDARHLDVTEVMGNNKGWFDSTLGKLDTAQQYGKRAISDVSGMAPITLLLEKIAVVGIAQKFTRMAFKPTKANMARMRSLGLSEDMLGRVLDQIRKYSTTENSLMSGPKVKTLGLQQWDDEDAFTAFKYASNRWAARMVQQNMFGETNPFFSTELGKTLAQFRSFVLTAYEKQLLHNIRMHDGETLAYALGSTFLAGLAYSGQTYINSIGRKDEQQYRDKMLSPEKIGAAAFSRSGMATLIPGTIDSVLRTTGRDPMFNYRSSGYSSNFFDGVPAVAFAKKLQGTATTLGGLTNDNYTYSKQDWRNNTGLVWFSNTLGMRNLLEIMGGDLPARSKPRE
jgi:hypothetical protein